MSKRTAALCSRMCRLGVRIALLLLLVLPLGMSEAKADLITNGGFETGDFTGWTVSDNTNSTYVVTGSEADFDNYGYTPYSGTYYAALGNDLSLGTLSQTISDSAGQSFTLSMYLGSDAGSHNEFMVQWDGVTLYDHKNLPDITGDSPPYNLLTFTVPGTGSDTLVLSQRDDSGYLALDNVSLMPLPEPSSIVLLIIGAAGLFLAARRCNA